jgi:cell shape-determining protein MreC
MDKAAGEDLRDLLERLAALEQRVRELEEENRQLSEQLDEAQRAAARQAAPFRRRDSTSLSKESINVWSRRRAAVWPRLALRRHAEWPLCR